jgi:hypothetical protein
MSDLAINAKLGVMGMTGLLIILGITFALYLALDQELVLSLIAFMILVTVGLYHLIYYLIQFLLFPYG